MEPNEKQKHLEFSEESVARVNATKIPEAMKARVREYARMITEKTEMVDRGDKKRVKLIADIEEYEDNICKVLSRYEDLLPKIEEPKIPINPESGKAINADGTQGMKRGVSSVDSEKAIE